MDALEAEAERVSKDLLLDFELSVATWDHKVKFERLVSVGPRSVDVLVDTDDEIYRYVNDGTVDHFVAPKKKGGVLAFPAVYAAKSTPGVPVSRTGGSSGPMVFSRGHMVSGIKARNFDQVIKKEWVSKYKRAMEKAMANARKASGHAI